MPSISMCTNMALLVVAIVLVVHSSRSPMEAPRRTEAKNVANKLPLQRSTVSSTAIDPATRLQLKTVTKTKFGNRPMQRSTKGATSCASNVCWEGVEAMNGLANEYFGKSNVLCQRIQEERLKLSGVADDEPIPLTMQLSFSCNELFSKSHFGTGNFISLFYGLRLATATHANIGLNLTCHDTEDTKRDMILPWLTGWFPPRPPNEKRRYPVSTEQACNVYRHTPIAHMYREMQDDFRRMAVGLVGIPSRHHPSALWARSLGTDNSITPSSTAPQFSLAPLMTDEPILPRGSIQLDDVAIHFRCGDLMTSRETYYGFFNFDAYTRHISPEARSIGILTQPFAVHQKKGQSRVRDGKAVAKRRCRAVVLAFVEYIQERFPTSRVTVHNGPSETIALAYARMVMANQTMTGMTSFGVFPTIATFGTGYYIHSRNTAFPNWLFNPRIDELTSNIQLVAEDNFMPSSDMIDLCRSQGVAGAVAWSQNKSTTH